MAGPRVLLIDVETAPNIVATFGTRNVFISNDQILQPQRMIAFAAKWYGKDEPTMFWSEHHHSHEDMIKQLFRLLDEADILIYFNGDRFDRKWANTEFIRAGLPVPSPYRRVDLYQQVKSTVYLESYKLNWVSKWLIPTEGKMDNSGWELWLACLGYLGEDRVVAAWDEMRAYNLRDVEIMEPIFNQLFPWMRNVPALGLYGAPEERDEGGKIVHVQQCKCGSTELEKRGFAYTNQGKYQQYRCKSCGRWGRYSLAIVRLDVSEVAR